MKLLPEDERKLFQKRGRFSIADVGRKRELKIKQFQKEKELKERVQVRSSSPCIPLEYRTDG